MGKGKASPREESEREEGGKDEREREKSGEGRE